MPCLQSLMLLCIQWVLNQATSHRRLRTALRTRGRKAEPARRLSSQSLTWQLESFPLLSSERVIPSLPLTDYNNKQTASSQLPQHSDRAQAHALLPKPTATPSFTVDIEDRERRRATGKGALAVCVIRV